MIDAFLIRMTSTSWQDAIHELFKDKNLGLNKKRMMNKCTMTYMGDISSLKDYEKEAYIEEVLVKCNVGSGAVLEMGKAGVRIYETEYRAIKNPPSKVQDVVRGINIDKYALISELDNGNFGIVDAGELHRMGSRAHSIIRQFNYRKELYIYTPEGKWFYICGKYRDQKTTKRQTDKNILVMPIYKYAIMGRANI